MDPSSLVPTPSAIFTTAEAPAAPPLRRLQLPTNMNSDDSWNDPPLPKLRLMCSYGGHIAPRPHDKSLCYIGGDTRLIVIDRHTSLSDLHRRLSKSLLNNQPFTLKYQLPNEDLDSLISVSSDEDLECMVEEYDRLNNRNNGLKISGRLRLFLFPKSSSIEHLLLETSSSKSGDWFLNVLNGRNGNLSTAVSDLGFSDSSSINYLLGLDSDFGGEAAATGNNIESQLEGSKSCSNHTAKQDVQSFPDSPMVETSSSFGSTSSTPSLANLPPIKVRMEENQKLGVEERFQQMNIGVLNGFTWQQRQESDGYLASAGTPVSVVPVMISGNYANPLFSGKKELDCGGNRKAEQAQKQMQVQFQQKQVGAFESYSHSPESVSSEGSATNQSSRQRQTLHQQPCVKIHSVNSRVSANQSDPKTGDQHMQSQVQESSFVFSGQFDQNHPPLHQTQQFVHADAQYNHAGGTPVTSYYPMHSSQQHSSQYPVYFLPARPTQPPYNMPVQQPNYRESAPAAASSNVQTPSPACNEATIPKAEMAAGVYRTAAPQFHQVPSRHRQHQTQYVAFTQIHHPSQSEAVSSAMNSSYAYEFADPRRSQVYYTQHFPRQLASHIEP